MGLMGETVTEVTDRIKKDRALKQEPEKPKREKPKREKPKMTKEEIEAYRQRKMAEEEARYLKMDGGDGKKRARRKKCEPEKPAAKQKRGRKRRSEDEPTPVRPKILKPLVPLHLLRIPGLPKGDCIAICYVEGVDA